MFFYIKVNGISDADIVLNFLLFFYLITVNLCNQVVT